MAAEDEIFLIKKGIKSKIYLDERRLIQFIVVDTLIGRNSKSRLGIGGLGV